MDDLTHKANGFIRFYYNIRFFFSFFYFMHEIIFMINLNPLNFCKILQTW